MRNLKRLAAFLLALALGLAPTVAQAGDRLARAARVSGAPAALAPIQLPALGAAAAGRTGLQRVMLGALPGVDVPREPGVGTLGPQALERAALADVALEPQARPLARAWAPLQPTAPLVAAAEPQAALEQAVRSFQVAAAAQPNGERVSRLAGSLLGWLKPRQAQAPVSRALAPDGGNGAPTLPASTPSEGPSGGGQEPPAPPSGAGSGRSSAWRDAILFNAGLVVAQVGVEAWGASWAKWVQTSYGLDAYTTITMVGLVVSLAAGYAGGWAADKFGVKKTYIALTVLFAASAAATLALFHAGGTAVLTMPLLVALAAVRTFVGNASRTAEQTIPIAIFKDDKGALSKYNSVSQFVLEFAGIGVPFMIGTMLGMFGSIGTMTLLPITAILACGIFLFVKMGQVKEQALAGPAKPEPKLLKLGMMTYPALALLNFLMYSILAIGYGNFVHPGASPLEQAAAAGIAGKLVSLYSVGGLIAAASLSGIPDQLWGWLRKKLPRLDRLASRWDPKDADEGSAEIKSISKWLILSAASLVSFIPMLWSNPLIAALAMIPFGMANVMSTLQVMTLIQKNTPLEKKGKIMGGLRTISTLVSTAGLFGFSWVFKHNPASSAPFVVLLGVLAAVGLYYVLMARKLARATLKK